MTKKSLAPFAIYLIGFYLAWSVVWVYGVYPWAVRNIGDSTPVFALINIAFRLAIWVLPVFWYLRRMDHVDPFAHLGLRDHWRRGLAVGLVLSAVNFAGTLLRIAPSNWRGLHYVEQHLEYLNPDRLL